MNGGLSSVSRMLLALIGLVAAAVFVSPQHAGGASVSGPESALRTIPILIGRKTIQARVADTDSTRQEGLLGWDTISDDTGMLLDFRIEGKYAIHMQGMKFPIDAVWIDQAGEIKLVYEDIPVNTGQIFPSMFPCRYCLELKAGFCKRFGVQTGQRVKLGVQAP